VSSAEFADRGSTPPAGLAGRIRLGGAVSANRIGFGAMRLPGVWGKPQDPHQARRLLRRAIELGVNFIDTAHAYGPETSERLIAEALYPYPEELIVATKSGYGLGPRGWAPDGRPETIRRHCQRSLEVLRLERIHLLQLHTVDPAVPIEESVEAMVALQAEGKVHVIGVSNVTVDELRRAQAVGEIVSVQNRYHLSDRASEPVLALCERAGIAFLPWFPLGAGALARAAELRAVADAHGATPAQVAIAWLLLRSPVLLPIPGTSSIAHLEENVAAAALRLSAEELRRLSD
jgi:pyridoxine 4-dehydrogenase